MPDEDDHDKPKIPSVYTLTSLTRSSGQSRRVVVVGFDVPLRGLVVCTAAVAASLLPTFVAWVFVGSWALIITVLFVLAALFLVERRARNGLQLRTYQAMIDKHRENIGSFLCCGVQVQPRMSGYGRIISSSMPGPQAPGRETAAASVVAADLGPDFPPAPTRLRAKPVGEHQTSPTTVPARVSRQRRRGARMADPFAALAESAGGAQ